MDSGLVSEVDGFQHYPTSSVFRLLTEAPSLYDLCVILMLTQSPPTLYNLYTSLISVDFALYETFRTKVYYFAASVV